MKRKVNPEIAEMVFAEAMKLVQQRQEPSPDAEVLKATINRLVSGPVQHQNRIWADMALAEVAAESGRAA
jgi:hypothetical protein